MKAIAGVRYIPYGTHTPCIVPNGQQNAPIKDNQIVWRLKIKNNIFYYKIVYNITIAYKIT